MMELLAQAATVGILATLISESKLFAKLRDWIYWDLFYCPICLSFWIGAPYLYYGFQHYFLVLALANCWMLVVLKLYRELDESSK